ncbi:MAG TPA: hypothetical protein VHO67_08685 [Polyangia bacterium]|nr:hypothetical protein [Polyangia bacterium]
MWKRIGCVPATLAVACVTGCAHQAPVSTARPERAPTAESIPLPASATVFLGCGFLLAENHGSTHFSLLLTGHDLKQDRRDPTVFIVDDVLFQTTVATASTIGDARLRGLELLRRHMAWEAAYVAEVKHWSSLRPYGHPVGQVREFPMFLWGYDAPEPVLVAGAKVNRMLYLGIAVDDVVFTIAAALRPGDDPGGVSRVLARVARTVRRSQGPLDVFAIAGALKPGVPAADCSRVDE